MKAIFILFITILILPLSLAEYYECSASNKLILGEDMDYIDGRLTVFQEGPCLENRGLEHTCQLPNSYVLSDAIPSTCTKCWKETSIPEKCLQLKVQPTNYPEWHEKSHFFADLFSFFSSDEETEKETPKQKCAESEELVDGECEYKCEFNEKYTNGKCVLDVPLEPNAYEITTTSSGVKVAHFVDVYGNDKYSTDGKHWYKDFGKAVSPGVTGIKNTVTDVISDFKDFFFKTKYKDKDKELQTSIAREVLGEFKYKQDTDVAKAHKKLSGKLNDGIGNALSGVTDVVGKKAGGYLKDLASVPADSVIEFAKEADATEFAQGARIYIKERETQSANGVYNNPSPKLQGEGGFGTVAFSLFTKYPKAVLFAKFEETYQRYELAKELGRTE